MEGWKRFASKQPPILYEFARAANGSAISINAYSYGDVTCFGCDRPLIPKAIKPGARKRPHFAHKAHGDTCNPETVLHRLSKALLQEAHRTACTTGRPYLLTWQCPYCASSQEIDTVTHWNEVVLEAQPVPGVQSDVLFLGTRPFAVEVVVTHDLEAQTIARYSAAGIPVFVIRPTRYTVSQLGNRIVATKALGIRTNRCRGCQAINTRVAKLERDLAAIEPLTPERAEAAIGPWRRRNRIEFFMYPKAREFLVEHACHLTRLGFTPTSKRKWEFRLELPSRLGFVCAAIDWDGEQPAREAATVRLSILLRVTAEQQQLFADPVVAFLQRSGVSIESDRVNVKVSRW